MFDIFDIYLLEALINGVLLGGVLALLALGLNLIFGVIDVVWICYAELIMLGMYGMYYLFVVYHVPFLLAAVICIAGVGVLGVVLHLLVIAPLLGAAPINQLLATGGVLFLLQSAATVMFGIDFRNLGIRLPVLTGLRHVHQLRAAAGVRRGAGRHGRAVSVPRPHLYRHGDPRHRAGPPDHAADGRRCAAHLHHHLGDRRRAGRPRRHACWCCNTTCIRSSA